MTRRANHRPEAFLKPAHWPSTPPPAPQVAEDSEPEGPTRYGDWVRNGIAIDF